MRAAAAVTADYIFTHDIFHSNHAKKIITDWLFERAKLGLCLSIRWVGFEARHITSWKWPFPAGVCFQLGNMPGWDSSWEKYTSSWKLLFPAGMEHSLLGWKFSPAGNCHFQLEIGRLEIFPPGNNHFQLEIAWLEIFSSWKQPFPAGNFHFQLVLQIPAGYTAGNLYFQLERVCPFSCG